MFGNVFIHMSAISAFLQNHMFLVFFVYGLSFFLLGAAVLFQTRKGSGFKLGRCLWLLAAFGLIHALNEWLDMFLLLESSRWSPEVEKTIKVMRFFAGKISYVFLFQFGITLLTQVTGRWLIAPVVSLIAYSTTILGVLVWGWHANFDGQWFLISDIAIRYSLAFPGSILTAAAFLVTMRGADIRGLHVPQVTRGLMWLGILFGVYAVAAGVIVKPAPFFPASVLNYDNFMQLTGFPVQVLRAVCAFAMAVFICRVLAIFEIETQRKMETAYREILRVSNREQVRIGQDLHDGIGQELTGIAYMNKALEAKLLPVSPAAAEDAKQIRVMLDSCINTVHALSKGLYPVSLEKNGLAFALREFGANAERLYGVACALELDESVAVVDKEVAGHLFRITQEAFANAVKHGHASLVKIRLAREGGWIILSILDDGSGIPSEADQCGGMGLQIMRYRAGVIGAELDIGRRPEGGTDVTIRRQDV